MSVIFVLGRPGTGKTARCLHEITERLHGSNPLYYLVPEQATLQAEKRLISTAGSSFLHVQALSFNRLAYHIFARLGGPLGKIVDDTAKSMLLRKVLYECGGELYYYARSADKQGFIDDLARTVTELNQYNVTAEDLELRIPEAEGSLAYKLRDLITILRHYRAMIVNRYLLTDETLDLLAVKMAESELLAGSLFWVDGFSGFTPQERKVLGLIMKTAERVTVTLNCREADDDPFYGTTLDTLRKLRALAQNLGVPVHKTVRLDTDYRHANHPSLRFFTSHFDTAAPVLETWHNEAVGIEIVSAPDRYAEADEAARRIRGWVAGGMRYRDIAILCGDAGGYEKILRNRFDRHGLPLFVDSKTDILSHPLTELIRAAVDIVVHDWPYESVFRFLKTRMTELDQDEIDILENYVLENGIKSYRWRYPFHGETTTGVSRTEATRLKVLRVLSPFTDSLKADKQETVKRLSHRVYDLLYSLDAPRTLSEWYTAREKANDRETARKHKQIWPTISGIFDKLVEILGDERVTVREFARILDAGFTQADLGLIPPSVDQVFMGDAGRSRFPDIKALLVLGANEGLLPLPASETGLFTDDERGLLQHTALELAPGLIQRTQDSQFDLYNVLAQPTEALVLTYSRGGVNGGELRPSQTLHTLKKLFPNIKESEADDDITPSLLWGMRQTSPSEKLSAESVNRLYGREIITSVSRIEAFAKCPFAYFITYTLQAKERRIYQVQSTDLGMVYHEVLARFSEELEASGLSWRDLNRDIIAERVSACVEAVVPADNEHVLHSTARNQYIIERVKRISTTSVWALAEHIKRGSFTPAGIELAFKPDTPVTTLEVQLNRKRKLILTGRIDRCDIYRADSGYYIKIIDYKSGAVQFDLEDVYLGTQLQLLLYMNALLKNAHALFGENSASIEAKPGGVFYFNIDDPILPTDGEPDPEEREALLLKCFRMSGLALAETEVIAGMDSSLRGDSDTLQRGESAIIPVTVNKDGSFGRYSSVADAESFERLSQFVDNKIKEIGLQMTEGVIEPNPYKKAGRSGCDYCRYDALCGYGHSVE